jgi:hypothetical protein
MTDQPNDTGDTSSPIEFITTAIGSQLVMSGPLAQMYSEGLNELYAKEKTTNGMALETQAVDLGMLRKRFLVAKQPLLDSDNKANMSLFYGVAKGAVRVEHVVDIVDTLALMNDTQRKHSVVIVDTVVRQRSGQTPEIVHGVALEGACLMEDSLRAACGKYSVPFYTSFEEFEENYPNVAMEGAADKKLTPSPQLGAVIGFDPITRAQAVSKIWHYIKEHKLQDEKNSRMINADGKLKHLFGEDQISMFEIAAIVGKHLKNS